MGCRARVVATLSLHFADVQVAVICGRNRQLLHTLRQKGLRSPTPIVAVGFVDNMHEWMGACDTVVTKAGPGTIAEALIAGLPILLNGNIPCQVCGEYGPAR